MKNFCLLCLLLLTINILSACDYTDSDIDDPMVGKTVEINSSLFLVSDIDKVPLTSSPTALELNLDAVDMDSVVGFSGYGFSVLSLKKFLPQHSKIKIIRAYSSDPPFLHIGGGGMDYYIAQTETNEQFTIAKYKLEDIITTKKNHRKDVAYLENLLASFSSTTERKSFKISTKDYYQENLFPKHSGPFSKEQISKTYKPLLDNVTGYDVSDIHMNDGDLVLTLKTNQLGLANIILKSNDIYISITPLSGGQNDPI